MYQFLVFFYLVTSMFISNLWSMDINDLIDTRILKTYPKYNVLVFNRGKEDGVYKNDHMKITNQQGFIARGICLKSTMQTSHWKMYRVVHPEFLSKDATYHLHSMNMSEIPAEFRHHLKRDYQKTFNDFGDKDVNRVVEMQQDNIINMDLPPDVKKLGDFEDPPPSLKREIVKNKIYEKNLKKDLSRYQAKIFASPLLFQTLQGQKNLLFGGALSNIGSNYHTSLYYREQQYHFVDITEPENQITGHKKQGRFYFVQRNFSPNLHLVHGGEYDQQKFRYLLVPANRTLVTPIGLQYEVEMNHLSQEDYFHLLCLPMIENRRVQTYASSSGSYGNEITEEVFSGPRLGLGFQFSIHLTESWMLKDRLLYRPYFDLRDARFDFENTMTENDLELNHLISKNFHLTIGQTYTNDTLLNRLNGISSTNHISYLSFDFLTQF